MFNAQDYFVGCDCLGAEDLEEPPVDIFGDLNARDVYDDLDEARGNVLGAESTITVEDVTPPSYVSTQGPVPSSPILEYGPPLSGAGSPVRYTDRATITAVQKKLKALGYFHGIVDGIYGPVTNAAIKNYSGKDGPPDDALLKKLGLAKELAFSDDEVDSMKVQAKTATTPAQVQVVAAKIEKLATDSPGVSPEVKEQAKQVQAAAASASTPQQVEQVKQQAQAVIQKIESKGGMSNLQIGLIAGGAALGVGFIASVIALARR